MRTITNRTVQRCLSLVLLIFTTVAAGPQPVSNLHVNYRGATYDISNVATVKDVQQQMQQASGLTAGNILFQGKRLEPTDILRDVGVDDGAQLQAEPAAASTTASTATQEEKSSTPSNPTDPNFDLDSFLKSVGVEKNQMDEFIKSMGGGGGGGNLPGSGSGKMPSMQESMEMMGNMMNSPIFQEYISDPEKLEESRQMILNNPFLKQMMLSMPGMQQLLESKEAWREAMQAAASLYKNLDSNQLLQSMMSNPGLGGSGGGLFDGTFDPKSTNLATASLDELDEGDD